MASHVDPDPIRHGSPPPLRDDAREARHSDPHPPARPAAGQPVDDAEPTGPLLAAAAVRHAPAWAISMLIHVVALLAMALVVSVPPKKDALRVITSGGPEPVEEFTELEDDLPEQPDVEIGRAHV